MSSESTTRANATELPREPERDHRWLARLLLLVGGLLLLDMLMTSATIELLERRRSTGGSILPIFFGMSWGGFTPIALAVWLTWGSGSIVLRLLAIVAVVTITCAFSQYLQHGDSDEMTLEFVGWLVFTLSQILILNALALPLRTISGWQLTFAPQTTFPPDPNKAKWSLFDVLAWTAFAAMALAFIRLHNLFLDNTLRAPETLPYWSNFITQSIAPVVSFPLVAWAVWGKHWGPLPRLALIVLALAAAFGCEQGYVLALSGRLRLYHSMAMTSGVVASALVHCAAMCWAGVRWRRSEAATPARAISGERI